MGVTTVTKDQGGAGQGREHELREKARQRLRDARQQGNDEASLLEELEVHRAELTLQNEELQQARNDLAAARDRYRDLFERAPVGYVLLDGAGHVRQANLAAADLLSVGREGLLDSDLASYIAPESQDEYFRHRRGLAEGADRQVNELVLRPGDRGEQRAVRLESVPEPGHAPGDPRFRTALVDVTERWRAEQALRRERDQLEERVTERTRELQALKVERERLLNHLGEGLFGLDRHGRFTFLNPRALGLLEWDSQQELLGLYAHAVLRPEHPDGTPMAESECPLCRALARPGGAETVTLHLRSREDRPLVVTANVTPVREEGGLVGVVVLFAPEADSDRQTARDKLSSRERQVLDRLVAGETNKETARQLSLSPRTVEAHRARIMDKLGVQSFAELVRLVAE